MTTTSRAAATAEGVQVLGRPNNSDDE